MTTELSKLNPKDYGLEESNAATIISAFQPKAIEKDALMQDYEELVKKELTPELCKEFRELRLKFVKVRTGIAAVHKAQKEYFRSGGLFCDALKNKDTLTCEQCESKLKEGEEYFERIEAKRIADLEAERTVLLSAYTDILPQGLGQLSDAAFNTYLTGAKVAYDARIEAERKEEELRIEQEKAEQERLRLIAIRKERDDNRFKIFAGTGLVFAGGVFANKEIVYRFSELCELDDDAFVVKVHEATEKMAEYRASEVKEKERLEAIARAKEKELALEKEKAEAERKKAAEEKVKADAIAEAERKRLAEEQRKVDEQRRQAEESLRIEREKSAKIAAEAKAKADAEAEAIRKAKAAPDVDKLKAFADAIDALPMPEIGNPEAAKLLNDTQLLLQKTTKYLREKIQTL